MYMSMPVFNGVEVTCVPILTTNGPFVYIFNGKYRVLM